MSNGGRVLLELGRQMDCASPNGLQGGLARAVEVECCRSVLFFPLTLSLSYLARSFCPIAAAASLDFLVALFLRMERCKCLNYTNLLTCCSDEYDSPLWYFSLMCACPDKTGSRQSRFGKVKVTLSVWQKCGRNKRQKLLHKTFDDHWRAGLDEQQSHGFACLRGIKLVVRQAKCERRASHRQDKQPELN